MVDLIRIYHKTFYWIFIFSLIENADIVIIPFIDFVIMTYNRSIQHDITSLVAIKSQRNELKWNKSLSVNGYM